MVDIQRILGNNLKSYRTQLRLTQKELAQLSGVNRSHLAGIESGILNPSIKTIAKLAAALNITTADLFSEQAKNE